MAAHELMSTEDHYEAKRNSNDALDFALSDAWDVAQEHADEDQIADDFLSGEHDRAGTTSDQKFEIAYDASVMRKDRAQARAEAAAGNSPDRPPAKVTKKAAADEAYTDHLSKVWDVMTGAPAKPAEQTPEATQPQQTDGGLSAEDRAALAQAPAETRAVIDRHLAAHRETYAPVDALAGKWSGSLAERGVATPAAQVQHLDRLLMTEHELFNGTREQQIAVLQRLADAAGLGAPTSGPAPQAQMQAHQGQMQAPPSPQPSRTGNAEHDRLIDQLGRDEHSREAAAWQQAMAQAGPEAQRQQTIHRAQQHIAAIATETKADGSPLRPYFGAVQREMAAGIVAAHRAGQQPNIAAIYDQAVASRGDIQEHKIANAHVEIRNFASENPVVFDPTIRARMNTIAAGHRRTGRPGDMRAILAEALRREPVIAAKYHRQISEAKAAGRKIAPTIDQQLEAAYAAGVGL